MLFTYVVYWGLIVLSILTGYVVTNVSNEKQRYILYCVLFLCIAFVLGGRYDVGTDWENYRDYYEEIRCYGISWKGILASNLEPLYLIINKCCAFLCMSTSTFFMTIMLIMLFLLFYATDKDYRRFHYVLFFFFTTFLASALNIQRQALATLFFFLSVKYIDRNIYKYFICVGCAFFIHHSSVVLFPFWLIGNKRLKVLDNRLFAITAYLCSLLFASILGKYINDIIPMFISSEKYLNNFENIDENMKVSSGLGILLNHMLSLVVIVLSKSMVQFYQSQWLRNMYRCFLIGVILLNIFGLSVYLARLPFSLYSLKVILYAYISYYLLHSVKNNPLNRLVAVFLIIICLAMSFFGIAHGDGGISPYEFKWI